MFRLAGAILSIIDDRYINKHIMRIYDYWVCLELPNCTWRRMDNELLGVKIEKGRSVTIKAK